MLVMKKPIKSLKIPNLSDSSPRRLMIPRRINLRVNMTLRLKVTLRMPMLKVIINLLLLTLKAITMKETFLKLPNYLQVNLNYWYEVEFRVNVEDPINIGKLDETKKKSRLSKIKAILWILS